MSGYSRGLSGGYSNGYSRGLSQVFTSPTSLYMGAGRMRVHAERFRAVYATGKATAYFVVYKGSTSAADRTIFAKWGNSSGDNILIIRFTSTGNLRVNITDNGTKNTFLTSTETYADGEWYHIAVTFDIDGATRDDQVKAYVNGSEITGNFSSSTAISSFPDSSEEEYVGSWFNSSNPATSMYMNLMVLDDAVYSSSTIANLYKPDGKWSEDDFSDLNPYWYNDFETNEYNDAISNAWVFRPNVTIGQSTGSIYSIDTGIGYQRVRNFSPWKIVPALIFVARGQSFVHGYTPFTDLPATYQRDIPNVKFWSGSSWDVLTYSPTNNQFPTDGNYWGMCDYLIDEIAEELGCDIFFFKYAVPGVTLSVNVSGDDWNVASTGELLDDCKTEWTDATDLLDDIGMPYKLVFEVWGQGESDSNSEPTALAYGTNLTDMMDDWFSHVGTGASGHPVWQYEIFATSNPRPYKGDVNSGKQTWTLGQPSKRFLMTEAEGDEIDIGSVFPMSGSHPSSLGNQQYFDKYGPLLKQYLRAEI